MLEGPKLREFSTSDCMTVGPREFKVRVSVLFSPELTKLGRFLRGLSAMLNAGRPTDWLGVTPSDIRRTVHDLRAGNDW